MQPLGLDGLRFHDLRHTAAHSGGCRRATTKELMERMGHTSPAVALRCQHVMADRQGAIAAAMDRLVREAENGNRPAGRARRGHDGPRRGSGEGRQARDLRLGVERAENRTLTASLGSSSSTIELRPQEG